MLPSFALINRRGTYYTPLVKKSASKVFDKRGFLSHVRAVQRLVFYLGFTPTVRATLVMNISTFYQLFTPDTYLKGNLGTCFLYRSRNF